MDTFRLFDVESFGARSHAPETSTQAFQKAIDACAESGGGTVFVPPGEYVIGRVLLRSNVTFHLAAGALVKPSRE
ncbi:MAG TPA: glycosyl hydrolase family 28-related protein, partial [Candidatus Latescibacteria bacterium]|nr:glycosyl hydrolase family 28-related protein [Candidatus Latescibacterota bacterium]